MLEQIMGHQNTPTRSPLKRSAAHRKLNWLRLLIQISGRSWWKIRVWNRVGAAKRSAHSKKNRLSPWLHAPRTFAPLECAREHRGGNHAAHELTVPSLSFKGIVGQFARQFAIDPSGRLDWARLARASPGALSRSRSGPRGGAPLCMSQCANVCTMRASPSHLRSLTLSAARGNAEYNLVRFRTHLSEWVLIIRALFALIACLGRGKFVCYLLLCLYSVYTLVRTKKPNECTPM